MRLSHRRLWPATPDTAGCRVPTFVVAWRPVPLSSNSEPWSFSKGLRSFLWDLSGLRFKLPLCFSRGAPTPPFGALLQNFNTPLDEASNELVQLQRSAVVSLGVGSRFARRLQNTSGRLTYESPS